jgi:hypothetical protein
MILVKKNYPSNILLGYIFVWSLPLTIHIPETKIQVIIVKEPSSQ